MQQGVEEVRLSPDLRNIGYTGYALHAFHQVLSCFWIFFTLQIGKLNTVHQRIETHCSGIVRFRLQQRRHFFPDTQCILICEIIISGRFGVHIHIF